MDDELSAARRRGAVRKLLWPHGRKHKGFMHGKRWMGAALILLVCALTVTGIAVFNGGGKGKPEEEEYKRNEGVLSLSDFFKVCADNIDFETAGSVHSLARRLINEPFEVSAKITVESEALKALGIPLTSLPADVEIKYDLRDAGIMVSAVGLDLLEAYVAENEITAVSMDGEKTVTELPAGDDLSGDMTLENRMHALVPLPSEDLIGKLLDVLAESVPEACSEQQLGRAYSPKDKKDVNVTLVRTVLDDEALSTAAAAFSERLQSDEALYDATQQLIADNASLFGEKDITLDSLLTRLINRDYEGITVSWKVFRRDEVPVGFAARVTTRDAQVDVTRMAEFDGETGYEYSQLLVNGVEVFFADTVTKDASGEFRLKTVNAGGEPVSVNGTFGLEQIAENTYRLTADAVADGKLLGDEKNTAHFVIEARIDAGSGLGMLGDSPDWREIKELKEKD